MCYPLKLKTIINLLLFFSAHFEEQSSVQTKTPGRSPPILATNIHTVMLRPKYLFNKILTFWVVGFDYGLVPGGDKNLKI